MSQRRYEVLLRRPNGINKTVYIDDCLSENEARETAEAMYGMEVLRVLWAPTNSGNDVTPTHSSSSGIDIDDFGSIGGILALFVAIVAIGILYYFWWLFLIIGIILVILYKIGDSD